MDRRYSWAWVGSQVSATVAQWNACAEDALNLGSVFDEEEQRRHEEAYDRALIEVEREAKRARMSGEARRTAQRRIIAAFPRFASLALGLEENAIRLLTEGFLPTGTQFAQWARRFDPSLSMADTVQACRNAWTVCGLQPLLGDRMQMTPAIIGYSLLYPYTDNYFDRDGVSNALKMDFSARFRDRLCGLGIPPHNAHQEVVWSMVGLIEEQYPRSRFPNVYEALISIHQAQENSLAQLKHGRQSNENELLYLSCAKGGTSVVADACLCHGSLSDTESQFAFDWGVLLQLGDDLQDVQEDLRQGAATLFSRAALAGTPLDDLVRQLLTFSEHVADEADRLPNGDPDLKQLLRMSWRSLILMAVARSPRFFTPEFLAQLEPASNFRFEFLRNRHKRLAGRRGLYKVLLESFLDAEVVDLSYLPCPETWLRANASYLYRSTAKALPAFG